MHTTGICSSFTYDDEQFFCEYRGATSLTGAAQGMWCEDILKSRLIPEGAMLFEQQWGYPLRSFAGLQHGVLGNGATLGTYFRERNAELAARKKPAGCVFAINPVYSAVLFATLSIRMSRYGGARAHEQLQLRLDSDCLEVKFHRGYEVVVMNCLPKGHKGTSGRPSVIVPKIITAEALRIIEAIGQHRQYTGDIASKIMAHDGVMLGLPEGRYIFQIRQKALSSQTLNKCLAFIYHGTPVLSSRGEERAILPKTHDFRHGLANFAAMNGVHDKDIQILLNHKNVDITRYYARPTRTQEFNTIASIATQGHLWMQDDARAQSSSESQGPSYVLGGRCTYPGECHLARGCAGCALKQPDHTRRSETELYIETLKPQHAQAVKSGWKEAGRLERHLADAVAEIEQMDFQQWLEQTEAELDQQEARIMTALRAGV
ncbi:site-specific integrase [Deinococcus humi]|uniref:Tyr recombinase domain-containing protein n=1 Tax=Deinococcus humi TaxID=662880 RepID=A0A7W8JWJ8_9DEIO|nr:site-specific integrase [Deinococcus humi]MBB5364520.1 hypothetical protein [Deinococcus humi]GGO38012.1 hypothetical protein GCM10008949_44000 [Deinococcus humi]